MQSQEDTHWSLSPNLSFQGLGMESQFVCKIHHFGNPPLKITSLRGKGTIAMMMNRVANVKALPGYKLDIVFRDGVHGIFDCPMCWVKVLSETKHSRAIRLFLPSPCGPSPFPGGVRYVNTTVENICSRFVQNVWTRPDMQGKLAEIGLAQTSGFVVSDLSGLFAWRGGTWNVTAVDFDE